MNWAHMSEFELRILYAKTCNSYLIIVLHNKTIPVTPDTGWPYELQPPSGQLKPLVLWSSLFQAFMDHTVFTFLKLVIIVTKKFLLYINKEHIWYKYKLDLFTQGFMPSVRKERS